MNWVNFVTMTARRAFWASTDHPAATRLGGPRGGKRKAPSWGKRVPLVVKGIICQCKEGSHEKGLGIGAHRDKFAGDWRLKRSSENLGWPRSKRSSEWHSLTRWLLYVKWNILSNLPEDLNVLSTSMTAMTRPLNGKLFNTN